MMKISFSHKYKILIWLGRLIAIYILARLAAVSNKLEVFDLPVQFQSIRKLEKVLIAKCLLFKKSHYYAKWPDAKNIWNNM